MGADSIDAPGFLLYFKGMLRFKRGIFLATIDDVAKRAGVSRSTVSLVINRSPKVKESTRLLVENVITQMNYHPNSNARGLSARVTNNLAVIIMQDYLPGTTRISYDNDQHVGLCSFNISNGIQAGLIGTDYGIITERFCSVADPDALPRVILEKRVDGAFVVGIPYSEQFVANMKKTGIPFVMVGVGSFEEGVDSIYADPEEGTELAVRELLRTGHKHIALMNCPRHLRSHEERLNGCLRAMNGSDCKFDKKWNLSSQTNSGQGAYEAFKAFWEAGGRPDAVACANGQSATGVLAYLYEKGVRVPEQVSVIAYEDSSLCGYAAPALTSVNIRKEDLGYRAAQCLIARIQNPDKRVEINSVRPYLVWRDSIKER